MGNINVKKPDITKPRMNPSSPFRTFPIEVQRLIYEYAGPDNKTKAAFDECMKYFKTGRVGIPYWLISIDYEYESDIIYDFIIPSYDYYERIGIMKKKWRFPKMDNYSETTYGNIMRTVWYCIRLSDYMVDIRNNTFMKPGDKYVRIIDMGEFDTPFLPITFQEMNDYDILYSLKAVRFNISNVSKWVEIIRESDTSVNIDYLHRILTKWVEKCNRNI